MTLDSTHWNIPMHKKSSSVFYAAAPRGLAWVMLLTGLFAGCHRQPRQPVEPTATEQTAETPAQEPAAAENRPNLLKRTTQEVVDLKQAQAENPALIEVENKITGQDPLTTSLQGYIALSSRPNVINFQHQVNTLKAIEDRNLTYDEIMQLIKQTRMEFSALPDYQTYAYDAEAGRFTILEDPAAKEKFQNQ